MSIRLSSDQRRSRSARSAVAAVIGGMLVAAGLAVASPSQAAPSHTNTDPYTTGCSKSAYVISSKAVAGGTASVLASRSCSTNWIEYKGKKQSTVKRIKADSAKNWTRTETDNAGWSYSMQSHAPGTTKITATIKIGNTTTTARCSYGCTWSAKTENPPPPKSSTLEKKVDDFVKKHKGKRLDFDGAYGAQCVDLVQFYNRDVIKAKRMTTPYSGGAKDIYQTFDTGKYKKIGPKEKAKKGDVAVWGGSKPYTAGYGHISIVIADQGTTLRTFSQNPGAANTITDSKAHLLGYLRPKV